MHIFANHVPEFLSKYGNLVMYTQQGMEKLNDETTINFARSTNYNFRNLDALKQLLQKRIDLSTWKILDLNENH